MSLLVFPPFRKSTFCYDFIWLGMFIWIDSLLCFQRKLFYWFDLLRSCEQLCIFLIFWFFFVANCSSGCFLTKQMILLSIISRGSNSELVLIFLFHVLCIIWYYVWRSNCCILIWLDIISAIILRKRSNM